MLTFVAFALVSPEAWARGGQEAASPAGAAMDAETFTKAFLEIYTVLPPGADPAEHTRLVDLVTTYNWLAVSLAMEALEYLDPKKDSNSEQRREALAVSRALASILKKSRGAPKLAETVERVGAWTDADWKQCRAARRLEGQCIAFLQRSEWKQAREKSLETEKAFRELGHHFHLANAEERTGVAEWNLGDFRAALETWERALRNAEGTGSDDEIAMACLNIGAAQNSLGDYGKAASSFERARELAEKSGKQDTWWMAINNLGAVHDALGNHEKSLRYKQMVLEIHERGGDERDLADALHNLGNSHDQAGNYEKAVELQERALAIHEKMADPQGMATCLNSLGITATKMGRLEKAQERHERALAIYERAGNDQDIAMSLDSLAQTLSILGQWEEARKHLERSLALREKVGNRQHIGHSLNNLGAILMSLGHLETALEHYERALVVFEQIGNRTDLANALNNLGSAHAALGQEEKAVQHHERAVRLREESGNEHRVAVDLIGLAVVYASLGRYDDAIPQFERALGVFEKVGNETEIATALYNIARTHSVRGDHEKALETFQRSLALAEKVGNAADIADHLEGIAASKEGLDKEDQALPYLFRALDLREETGDHGKTASTLFNLAFVLGSSGRVSEARSRLSSALDQLGRARGLISADQERISYLGTWQSRLNPSFGVALDGGGGSIAPDSALALRAYESLHGIATADLFASRLAELPGGLDPELVAAERRITREIDVLERKARELEASSMQRSLAEAKDARERRDALRKEQRRLEADWQDVASRMARQNPQLAALRRPDPVTLLDLKGILPAGSAYLAFALGDADSYLLVIDRADARHYKLESRGVIEAAVAAYLEALHSPPARGGGMSEAILSRGRRLYELLLEPAENELALHERLLIAPEGALYGLPFETLIRSTAARAKADSRNVPFLVRTHSVSYVHSATAWILQRKRCAERARRRERGEEMVPKSLLVLADPVSPGERRPAEEGVREPALAELRGVDLGRLPGSREEALSVVEAFVMHSSPRDTVSTTVLKLEGGGQSFDAVRLPEALDRLRGTEEARRHARLTGQGLELRLGRLANRQALIGEGAGLENHRLVHIAAHGLAHPENPGLSGVLLSAEKDQSGFIRLLDVMGLELRSEVVVLSACETQLGKRTSGEGYQGLVRGFLHAGAENVIASSWRVPDRASAGLLPVVYRGLLRDGLDASAALRKAQLEYLEAVPATSPELESPHFWGAWTAWGAVATPSR